MPLELVLQLLMYQPFTKVAGNLVFRGGAHPGVELHRLLLPFHNKEQGILHIGVFQAVATS